MYEARLKEWTNQLESFDTALVVEAIDYVVNVLRAEWPPNVIEFVKICEERLAERRKPEIEAQAERERRWQLACQELATLKRLCLYDQYLANGELERLIEKKCPGAYQKLIDLGLI